MEDIPVEKNHSQVYMKCFGVAAASKQESFVQLGRSLILTDIKLVDAKCGTSPGTCSSTKWMVKEFQ